MNYRLRASATGLLQTIMTIIGDRMAPLCRYCSHWNQQVWTRLEAENTVPLPDDGGGLALYQQNGISVILHGLQADNLGGLSGIQEFWCDVWALLDAEVQGYVKGRHMQGSVFYDHAGVLARTVNISKFLMDA